MRVQVGAAPQDVNQGARHVLFVEGSPDGLDVLVLGELLTPRIRVAALGPSFSVRSAAQSLVAYHPEYWFVVDRDEWEDERVEESWRTFPDPERENLLIWRRKELESYFLEPTWLVRSRYAARRATPRALEVWLAERAGADIWRAAANRVMLAARNRVKGVRGALLRVADTAGASRDDVEERLVAASYRTDLEAVLSDCLDEMAIRHAYRQECDRLTGGVHPLEWGRGRWRDLIPAKKIFRDLVNQWTRVPDLSGGDRTRLLGRPAERAVAVDLMKNHGAHAPGDLQTLRDLMERLTTAAVP